MRWNQALLHTAYSLLYHQFAWTYDLVAAVVSLGRWQAWVGCVQPCLAGRVLEIGYGPGHLQVDLRAAGLSAFGVDESRQMALQARNRLVRMGLQPGLTRGFAQQLPFQDRAFQSVVSTFPSEYIFDDHSLLEIRRVLLPGGRLVLLPVAWISGDSRLERWMAGLLRWVGETPGRAGQLPPTERERLEKAGFHVESEIIKMKGSQVLRVVCTKDQVT